jgi:hypothetical protein
VARSKRRTPPQIVDLPSPQAELVDRAMERDRTYFAANPDEEWYVRPALVGEWGAYFGIHAPFVLVRQIAPGLRLRQPVSERVAGMLAGAKADGIVVFFTES